MSQNSNEGAFPQVEVGGSVGFFNPGAGGSNPSRPTSADGSAPRIRPVPRSALRGDWVRIASFRDAEGAPPGPVSASPSRRAMKPMATWCDTRRYASMPPLKGRHGRSALSPSRAASFEGIRCANRSVVVWLQLPPRDASVLPDHGLWAKRDGRGPRGGRRRGPRCEQKPSAAHCRGTGRDRGFPV